VAATGVAVVVLVAGAVTAYASTRSENPTYRTATVATQTVQQTLQATGTVEPGQSATVSFPVSGTVKTVAVAVGDSVRRGQVLATLDTTSLRSSLADAQSTLAQARLTVHKDKTGQSTAASSGSGSGGSGASTGSSSTRSSSGSSTKALAAAQQRLLGSVRQVDAALARTSADLAVATSLCTTGSSSPTPTPSPTPGAGTTPAPTTCADAQALVLTDETTVQKLQQALAQQESQLDRMLTAALRQASAAQQSSGGTSSGSNGGGSTGSGGSGSTAVSSSQLAADQAAVDAAEAQVAVARQNLRQAVITSPLTGVVATVGVTVGGSVSAGSSTSAVQVIDTTAHIVTVGVDVTKVPLVKAGQHATVVPDGTSQELTGTVSYVAAAPSSSGGSTYEVRLTLDSAPADLRSGIQAAVTIVVTEATGLAVPTSAVGHLGSVAYVIVAEGGTTSRQVVTVGAVGAQYTQVTKGLNAGQQVVLANVDEAIPSSTQNNRFSRFAGAGGLGGLGGGGFVVGGGPGRG
jgi:multidrug efflux pump subunit AcrA (membrane-fusion protein)